MSGAPDYPPLTPLRLPGLTPPLPDRRRWSTRTHHLLSALAVAIFLVGVVSYFGGAHYYFIDRVLPDWGWFFCASLIPRAAAAFDENRGNRAQSFPPLLAAGTAAVALAAMTFIAPPTPHTVSSSSPSGATTAVFTVGVGSRYGQLDLHQNRGALSRLWYAGCLNGEQPDDAFADMAWSSSTTLVVRTKGGQRLVIRTDPTGRPLNHVTTGENYCR